MNKTYFISGHLDISQQEWDAHYKDRIDKAIKENANFVIGDAKGVDYMSALYLWNNSVKNVTIYHMFKKPLNNPGYPTKGSFKNHEKKDSTMTKNSGEDIVWVRSEKDTKLLYGDKYRPNRISGTQKNLNRRKQTDKYIDCSKVYVDKTDIGFGVFAKIDIKKDQCIEHGIMTRLVNCCGNENPHLFTWSDDRKVWAIGSGCLTFYNHSDTPNIKKIGNLEEDTLKVIALQDIKAGEELCGTYSSKIWRTCFQSF